MGSFFLIDQSLKGVGGHHFDYTKLVSRAATQANWNVVIGCHNRFRHQDIFPDCELRNCFRFTTYASCSSLVGIQEMVARRKRNRIWQSLTNVIGGSTDESRRKTEQERRIQAFRENCHTFFARPLRRDDVVFFTTLSDLEAEGLALFIRDRPDAKLANWHLQFHFPIFRGRTPDYPSQEQDVSFLKNAISRLNTLSREKIHFYVTSETLKDQYDRLEFDFESLTYPVNPNLRMTPDACAEPSLNARLTFAGAVRHEKGGRQIEALIDELESEFGKSVRFCLQRKKKNLLARIKSLFQKKEPLHSNVEIHHYPLSAEAYQNYIKNSDIGLLTTYDSETYFSRRAGILGEYLTAGVPVIVPAGCWLSDQIESQQQTHLQNVMDNRELEQVSLSPRFVSNHSNGSTSALFEVGNSLAHSSHRHAMVIIGFDVLNPAEHGNYVRVKMDENGSTSQSVIGLDRRGSRRFVPFYVSMDSTEINIELSPEFGSDQWQVAEINANLVLSKEEIPRSVVGLVATDRSQTARLTGEVIRQFGHYKKSTVDFSQEWFSMHDPRRTFDTLLRNSDLTKSTLDKAA